MPRVNILGVDIDSIGKDELLRSILDSMRTGDRHVYAYANIHALNLCQHDASLRDFFHRATKVYCDGEGVRLGARILGESLPGRIVLTRFIWEIGELCERQGASVFLLGGRQDIVEKAARALKSRYSRLEVAGWHHGYFDRNGKEAELLIEQIREARPDILFVGLGMPAQEHWIDAHLPRLNTRVIFPCGSMIDYVAGIKTVAPKWMFNHGMEWMFRLLQEPRRLWRRYLVGNPLFLYRVVARQILSRKSQ